jgi:hypothetical protein
VEASCLLVNVRMDVNAAQVQQSRIRHFVFRTANAYQAWYRRPSPVQHENTSQHSTIQSIAECGILG